MHQAGGRGMFSRAVALGAACAALLALGAVSARASVIDWALQGVTFTDGGTATGTFSTDSISGDVLTFDITTTAGTKLGGTVYDSTSGSVDVYNNKWATDSFDLTDEGAHVYLELAFANPLNISQTDSFSTQNPSYECNNCRPFRIASAGEAVVQAPAAVPEPMTAAMLLVGLLGLGFLQFADRYLVARRRA